MIQLVKKALLSIIDNIDAGHTELSEQECVDLLGYIAKVTDREEKLSKEQACLYIKRHANRNISRATFDNYVRLGIIPKGRDEMGFKEKFWNKKDLKAAVDYMKS